MAISLKVIIPTNLAASSPSQKKEKGEAGGQLPDFLSEVFPPQILYPTSQCWEQASTDLKTWNRAPQASIEDRG